MKSKYFVFLCIVCGLVLTTHAQNSGTAPDDFMDAFFKLFLFSSMPKR